MKKIIETLQFIAVLVVLPLAEHLALLFTWPVLVVSLFIILLLGSQPAIKIKEASKHRKTDQGTLLLILLVSSLGQAASILEWAYMRQGTAVLDAWNCIGLALLVVGISIRLWAIKTLSHAFSATVQIKQGQQFITSGPYRWLRHPSYTGSWLLLMGIALVFHSPIGFVFMGPGMLWVYTKRIKTEERTLLTAFGAAYRLYKCQTWRILPGLL